jgi:hypothetical protein
MDAHPDAGGLGVKMIDGKGKFLPESKRGLPTPAVAFYKIFGISRLFPRSKRFGRYHLGYLDMDKTNEVEILSGAFMWMRKTALDKVGLLDEDFFMYGEDIDLSYRIVLGGYKNYYFPETTIIHYKGESTKKSSVNYVFVFYNAMVIFAKKHFSEKNAKTFSLLINMAIYLRASVAILNRFIKRIFLPALDFLLIFLGLFFIAQQYQKYTGIDFPDNVINIALPGYALSWLGAVWLAGGYDKPLKLWRILIGLITGTTLILAVYGLMPKDWQFSRVFILFGAAWATAEYMLTRWMLHLAGVRDYSLTGNRNKRFAIVGKPDEAERVSGILRQTNNAIDFLTLVEPESIAPPQDYAGNIDQLNEIVDVHRIDEVVFCARDNSAQQIIHRMSTAENRKIDFKIAQPESLYLIGSNSIDTSGDLYVLDINSINLPGNIRNKRIFDFLCSALLIPLLPLLLLVNPHLGKIWIDLWKVLFGFKSMVTYANSDPKLYRLPKIKKGLFSTTIGIRKNIINDDLIRKVDIIYAKDYRVMTDLKLVLSALRRFGRAL